MVGIQSLFGVAGSPLCADTERSGWIAGPPALRGDGASIHRARERPGTNAPTMSSSRPTSPLIMFRTLVNSWDCVEVCRPGKRRPRWSRDRPRNVSDR